MTEELKIAQMTQKGDKNTENNKITMPEMAFPTKQFSSIRHARKIWNCFPHKNFPQETTNESASCKGLQQG